MVSKPRLCFLWAKQPGGLFRDRRRVRSTSLVQNLLWAILGSNQRRSPVDFDVVTYSTDCSVGDTGIEPVTSSVSGKRATAAPIAQSIMKLWRWRRDLNPCGRLCRPLPRLSATPPYWISALRLTRADDEIRTRDPHLGKVMRYHCATSARPLRDSSTIPKFGGETKRHTATWHEVMWQTGLMGVWRSW